MKKVLSFLVLFTAFNATLFSQLIFEKSYGNTSDLETAKAIAVDGDFVLVAGSIGTGLNSGDDILLKKTGINGEVIWQKNIGGTHNEVAHEIIVLEDGYALGGYTKTKGRGGKDFYLVKTDFNGNVLWEKTYGSSNLESCKSLIATADGGFLLVGHALVDEVQGQDWWMVKTDASGKEEWSTYYGNISLDLVSFVKQSADGTFLVGGSIGKESGNDRTVIRLDKKGELIWDFKLLGRGVNLVNSFDDVIEMANKDLILLGNTGQVSLTKINEKGNLVWDHIYREGKGLAIQKTQTGTIQLFDAGTKSEGLIFEINPVDGLVQKENTFASDLDLTKISDVVISEQGCFVLNAENKETARSNEMTQGYTVQQFDDLRESIFGGAEDKEYQAHEEWGHQLVETNTGDYIFSGIRTDLANEQDEIILTKTAADGSLLWEEIIHNTDATPSDLIAIEDGGVLMLNYVEEELELLKINKAGKKVWTKYFQAARETSFSNNGIYEIGLIRNVANDGFIIAANVGRGVQLIRIDEDGNVLFSKVNATDYAVRDLLVQESGDFLLVSLHDVLSYDGEGDFVKKTSYNLEDKAYFLDYHSIAPAPDRAFWLYGTIKPKFSDPYQTILVKVDQYGEKVIEEMSGTYTKLSARLKVVTQADHSVLLFGSELQPIDVFSDGVFYNIQREKSFANGLESAFIESRSETGAYQWRQTLGLGKGVNLYDGLVDAQGAVVGLGWTYHLNSDDQYLVKLNPNTFIEVENPVLAEVTSKVFPNPGENAFQYDLISEANGELEIRVFNATGQLVNYQKVIKSTQKETISFDALDLASGVYYIQARLNGKLVKTDKWMKMGER